MKSFRQYDEATNVNKQDVPVYAAIEGKRGHYKVIGHVRRSAKSTGAAKLGKQYGAVSAKQTMKLKSKEHPEGPGWVLLSGTGPHAKDVFIKEDYNLQTVAALSTSDLGTVYRWLKWGNAAKTGLPEKDPKWAKQRDIIGSELGKRARKGEEDAKRALNNRMTKNVDKYGKNIKIPTSPPKPTLLQKIAKTLRAK